MTRETQERIITLRKEGNGYGTIAREVGISKALVRYYCKANSLDGKAEDILYADGIKCPMCGGDITQPAGKGRHRKFCSAECRRKWWHNHPMAGNKSESAFYPATCRYCGKEFKAYGNKHRKFCSRRCSADYHFNT